MKTEQEKRFPLEPENNSDLAEAIMMCDYYHNRMITTPGRGFQKYNGKIWEQAGKGVNLGKEFLLAQLADAKKAVENTAHALKNKGVRESELNEKPDALIRKYGSDIIEAIYDYLHAERYLNYVLKRCNTPKIKSMLTLAEAHAKHNDDVLDENPMLLNTPAGTVDLKTGDILKHDPLDYITRMTLTSPSGKGKKIWEDALCTYFCNDAELIKYCQLVIGSSLVGAVYNEKMIVAVGSGANGKSTFFNAINRILHSYGGHITPDALLSKTTHNFRPELADIKGVRLLVTGEPDEGKEISASKVKQFCSTDPIMGERKFHAPFSFIPSHTLILYANTLPKITSIDNGTWRRISVIPFNAQFKGGDDKKNYTEYLIENAGGYILKWLIDGAKEAIAREFIIEEPPCVKAAITDYKADSDLIGKFISDRCRVDTTCHIKACDIQSAYRKYCDEIGEKYISASNLKNGLTAHGIEFKRRNNGNIYIGLTLKQ